MWVYIILLCSLIIISLCIWVYKLSKQKIIDIPPTSPNVINLNPHLMNGHRCGFELSTKASEDGEHLVTVIPNDYLPNSEGKTIDEIKPYSFVVGRKQRVEISPGHLGGQKSLVIYLPSSFRKIDRKIAESDFGKLLINGLQQQELENQTYFYLKKIENTMKKLLISHPDKAVALANAEIKDTIQDALSSLSLKKEEEKKSGFDRMRDMRG